MGVFGIIMTKKIYRKERERERGNVTWILKNQSQTDPRRRCAMSAKLNYSGLALLFLTKAHFKRLWH